MIDDHLRAEQLLPWHSNGTLRGQEREEVRAHASNCVTCHGQLRWLEELGLTVEEAPTPVFDTEAALASFREYLDSGGTMDAERAPKARWWPPSRPVRWVLLAQVAVLATTIGLLFLQGRSTAPPAAQPRPGFRTLATPGPEVVAAAPRVRVLFSEGTTEQQIRELLHDIGGRIVDGPNDMGLYAIELRASPGDETPLEAKIAVLRARDGVRFAELVGPWPTP